MVPPRSDRISRVPPYSRIAKVITRTGLSPAMVRLSRRFRLSLCDHWPGPRSLATTCGVSVDVLSSGYLDVSVPRVRLPHLWIQSGYRRSGGLPHSEIHGSMPARGSPWLIATCCVLHRLSVPRHPPDALQTLDLGAYSKSKSPLTNAPRAGESPQGTNHQPARIRQRCIIMTQPAVSPCEATALSGHPRSLILFTCQRSHIRLERISAFSLVGYRRLALLSTAGSLKVTVRHSALPPGGGGRDRTDDLMLAKHALSQLSYAPTGKDRGEQWWAREDLNFRPHAYQARALTN